MPNSFIAMSNRLRTARVFLKRIIRKIQTTGRRERRQLYKGISNYATCADQIKERLPY